MIAAYKTKWFQSEAGLQSRINSLKDTFLKPYELEGAKIREKVLNHYSKLWGLINEGIASDLLRINLWKHFLRVPDFISKHPDANYDILCKDKLA